MNLLSLKSTVLLIGAAFFGFGFSVAARAENSVTFTGGYTTTFSSNEGGFGSGNYSANMAGTSSSSRATCDDCLNEFFTNETWNANTYQGSNLWATNLRETHFGKTIGLLGYGGVGTLGSMMFNDHSSLWLLTPNSHPGFGFAPQHTSIKDLNVHEGGSPLLYVLLAGLSCFGALFLSRHKARITQ